MATFTGDSLISAACFHAKTEPENFTSDRLLHALKFVLRQYYRDLEPWDGQEILGSAYSRSLVAGTGEYAMPSGTASIEEWRRVAWRLNSTDKWIDLDFLDDVNESEYSDTTGQPTWFYERIVSGAKVIGLIYIPDATHAAGELLLQYRYRPTEPTATTESITIPDDSMQNGLALMLGSLFASADGNSALSLELMGKAERENGMNAETLFDRALTEFNPDPSYMTKKTNVGWQALYGRFIV